MTKTKRMIAILVAGGVLLVGPAGSALAFEPPGNEPEALFNPNPAGHPGSTGQIRAIDTGNTFAAWEAHFNSDQIDN